ncbi:2-amino-3,7-dideoxy-D-threo-hept-6-ulosonate synthase [Desulfovibrio litoralis]|uniref:2-amino-3,7-dideoxy-D-threo-hept-6-ulosonate synthase n=1 Tax=Desulfovibrio litoralis DSM 11393 TaxID=1121455 RepID=A0A1M7RUY6_9BACT|nr:2-amino-3,7-dideoxy-D-threo-hept-6-ulosonate synthase [Desulfovibrio litoralis]SHN50085.1 2-amino-3,7-dideoxy-D-threo-hept-6-ulosonate synthase [Desulfovibrio litoralis DSM 11393]
MRIGKKVRMARIFNRQTKRTVIVPMDHGVSIGPCEGLINTRETVDKVAEGHGDAVLLHKGLVEAGSREGGRDVGLIVHLSASTSLSPFPNSKTLVATVEDAIKLGADGVSVHINVGDTNESAMLADLGRTASTAEHWGMPLLAMIYGRGPMISNEYDGALVAHLARVGAELGADVVKVPYTGDIESFVKVVEGCCVPVVIAGGPKLNSTKDFLVVVHDAIKAGAAGLSVGRNVFQHPNVTQLVQTLRGLVHDDWSIEEALDFMKIK